MTHTNRVEQALAAIVFKNRVRAARAQDVMLTLRMADIRHNDQRRFLERPAVPSAFGRL